MALQTSGSISISQIKAEIGSSSYSLRTLSATAGKSTPDSMSEFYGYANIPTSGLIINLDAANINSYPGSGTTWNDLSGNGNNASLVSLGYTTDGGGAITFPNNCSSYATFGNKSAFTTLFTFVVFLKRSNTATARVISKDIGYYTNRQYAIQVGSAGQVNTIVWNSGGSLAIASGGSNIGTGWNMIAGSWDGTTIRTYINGGLNSTASLSGSNVYSSSMPLELGRVQEGCFEPYSGSMAIVLMYNRALGGSEVTQIWNGYRGRFGL